MSNPTQETTRGAVCTLAGQHVASLLDTHWQRLEHDAIETSEANGKPPVVKVRFSISFNPRSGSPRVVTKIGATTALKDECEDTADTRQAKLPID
jgi:hypothetical protein